MAASIGMRRIANAEPRSRIRRNCGGGGGRIDLANAMECCPQTEIKISCDD